MWSMPHRVLQVVALLIGLCAVSGFALGLSGSGVGRPHSSVADAEGTRTPLTAADATPLNTDAPLPPEPVGQEKTDEDEQAAKDKAKAKLAEAKPPVETPPLVKIAPPPPPPDQVGDLIDAVTPPEEPPH